MSCPLPVGDSLHSRDFFCNRMAWHTYETRRTAQASTRYEVRRGGGLTCMRITFIFIFFGFVDLFIFFLFQLEGFQYLMITPVFGKKVVARREANGKLRNYLLFTPPLDGVWPRTGCFGGPRWLTPPPFPQERISRMLVSAVSS